MSDASPSPHPRSSHGSAPDLARRDLLKRVAIGGAAAGGLAACGPASSGGPAATHTTERARWRLASLEADELGVTDAHEQVTALGVRDAERMLQLVAPSGTSQP